VRVGTFCLKHRLSQNADETGGVDPSYRPGIRWESPKLDITGMHSDAFDGSGGAGFEIGLMYFTDPRFCFGGCM